MTFRGNETFAICDGKHRVRETGYKTIILKKQRPCVIVLRLSLDNISSTNTEGSSLLFRGCYYDARHCAV